MRMAPNSQSVRRVGKPVHGALDEGIQPHQKDKYLDGVNAAYAVLRMDSKSWTCAFSPTLSSGSRVAPYASSSFGSVSSPLLVGGC